MFVLNKSKDDVELITDAFLKSIEGKITGYKDHLSLKGKNIEVANMEQGTYPAYYDEIKLDLKSLLSYYELRVKEVKAEAWKAILTHSKLDHSDREKEILVNENVSYKNIQRTFLYVKEFYDLLDGICEQFKARAYALNNLTKIRVAGLEGVSLYD